MYGYEWTDENGIFRLTINQKISKEIRPVFKQELDYFGLGQVWEYPNTEAPLLWAEGIRNYVLNGKRVAEAKGGGFYTKPEVVIYQEDLRLEPIDIRKLWQENEALMKGLEQSAIKFIRENYELYKKQGHAFVVAFSGGKDSLVLLDLVNKALSPDEFFVIFSNTGMELDITLQAVEQSKRHWKHLRFVEAKSHMEPDVSWETFGPPGRRLRWCCAVHKSVPTILKLRDVIGDSSTKAVVFDGVRAEESVQRSQYNEVSIGSKNINQVNCSPILKWSSSEIFLYLLHDNLIFNQAYKQGLFRVGCIVCPLSSFWWEGIVTDIYSHEVQPLLKKIEDYANAVKPKNEQKSYIEKGGWKGRIGGRGLIRGGNRVIEHIESDTITFDFTFAKQEWLSVAPILGPIIDQRDNQYFQIINGIEFIFTIKSDKSYSVSYKPYSKMDRFIVSHIRGVANKVAYCEGCKACVVQCPSDAFQITDDGNIFIREDRCIHCFNCLDFTNGKGCLVAKSLSVSGGKNMDLKGMNRYQHFGFRKPWLEHFFSYKSDCFTMGQLGNRQYDALKVWLREAGLLSAANRGEKAGLPTPLFGKIEHLGPYNPLTWAIIWANLAYNSVIVKWYMLYVPAGEVYEKNDLVFMLGDDYSQSTRDNAVTALLETMRHSPIGSVLKQGIPIGSGNNLKYAKQGWETPEGVAILYSLYLWAEATDRYSFTINQLNEARGKAGVLGVDPVSIFGLNPDNFKDLLQELALHYENFIRVTFVVDLDTVKLDPEVSSLDILDII
jgi:phosphoadenosine phosphosulfate reductase